jgi:serine phosphatase RsbU (regulator of sigma subunit)
MPVLARLVRVCSAAEEGADTRQMLKLKEVQPFEHAILQIFAQARLVVMGRKDDAGDETVELAHEALIRSWSRLRQWIDDDRSFLLWRQELSMFLANWQRAEFHEGALLRGVYLASAQRWMERRGDDLSEPERAFIRDSMQGAEAEQLRGWELVMGRENEQAAAIQREYLLPKRPLKTAGVEIANYALLCRTVGADYCDYFECPDGLLALAIGDVTGKGIPAAMMMMTLEARLKILASEPRDTARLVTRLNDATREHCPANRFITFFFAVLDPATGSLGFSNAGHNPPLIVRSDGRVEYLRGGGTVLGIISWEYEQYADRLDSGDVLVIYTDGVTEASNQAEEEFGEDRLAEVVKANRKKSAEEIVAALGQSVSAWIPDSAPADDVTLMVVRRT